MAVLVRSGRAPQPHERPLHQLAAVRAQPRCRWLAVDAPPGRRPDGRTHRSSLSSSGARRRAGPVGAPRAGEALVRWCTNGGRTTSYRGGVSSNAASRVPVDDVDVLALDRQVCFALSVAARNVVAVYRPVLEPLGLTHPQYLVMLALWEHGSLSVKELSRLLQLDPGTISPLLKRLEAAGLLRRERDPKDQRNLALALTDSGKALRAEAETIPAGIVERLGMPIEELMALHGALTQVIAASQRALTTPAVADGTEPQATVA